MILRIQHKELTIDLDMRERIILHLAQDLPLPRTPYDVDALPRTVAHLAKALGVKRSTAYDQVEEMMAEKVVTLHPLALSTHEKGAYSNVYMLTPEGELLAEAIRRRAT